MQQWAIKRRRLKLVLSQVGLKTTWIKTKDLPWTVLLHNVLSLHPPKVRSFLTFVLSSTDYISNILHGAFMSYKMMRIFCLETFKKRPEKKTKNAYNLIYYNNWKKTITMKDITAYLNNISQSQVYKVSYHRGVVLVTCDKSTVLRKA